MERVDHAKSQNLEIQCDIEWQFSDIHPKSVSQDVSKCVKAPCTKSHPLPATPEYLHRRSEPLGDITGACQGCRNSCWKNGHMSGRHTVQYKSRIWFRNIQNQFGKYLPAFSLVSMSRLHSMGKCDPRSACATSMSISSDLKVLWCLVIVAATQL